MCYAVPAIASAVEDPGSQSDGLPWQSGALLFFVVALVMWAGALCSKTSVAEAQSDLESPEKPQVATLSTALPTATHTPGPR